MTVAETAPASPQPAQPGSNLDGYAYPYTDSRGTYLVVGPPQGDGQPVDYDLVERELKKLNITGVNYDRVRQAVAEATGKPFWILDGEDPEEVARRQAEVEAEAKANAPVDKSSNLFLTIADDAVSATLTIVPPPPDDTRFELLMEDVNKLIEDNGIVFGVSEERMAEVADILERVKLGDWSEPVEVEIAHGLDPQHGQDTRYEFFFDQQTKEEKSRPKGGDDERVDYFAVQEIENTKRGQAIARRVLPTRGIPGKSIKGEEIPARDGSEGEIKIGRGIEHALGNEHILVAAVDGQVKFVDNTLEVLALYEVPGDVDLSTGSIDFVGSVVVKGNVQPGFKVLAKEDVIVEGVVDDAEISSETGSVTVKGGVLGQGGKAKIAAGKGVTAKYVRNATIEAKRDVTVDEGILHSKVTAHSVRLSGKRGQIVGGEIVAEAEIVATTIGSNTSATQTLLTVGESAERRAQIGALTEQVKKMEEDLDKAEKGLAVMKRVVDAGGTLPPDKKVLLTKLTQARLKIQNELKPVQDQLQQVVAEEEEQRKNIQARISVMGTMYPGVKVQIRSAKRHIVEETRYCTLTEKGSEVKVGTFKK